MFHPGDILAPFAPNATDTSYKPGVDMLYGQYLFASGADLQAVWVPRALVAGGAVDVNASTFALHGAFQSGDLDVARLALPGRWARRRGRRNMSAGSWPAAPGGRPGC